MREILPPWVASAGDPRLDSLLLERGDIHLLARDLDVDVPEGGEAPVALVLPGK